MTISGTWRAGAYTAPGSTRPEPDRRHETAPPEDAAQVAVYTAPPQDDAGARGEYPGMDYVVETGGRIVDTTNLRDHSPDGGDHGGAVAAAFGERAPAFSDERYATDAFELTPATEVNPVALQRGLNGLPQNNPEGFRAGWWREPWANRRFPIGERHNDERVLLPDTAYADAGSQPLDDGAYPVPFGSLARSITNVAQRPLQRREPPPMGADLVDDGSPFVQAAVGSEWVM